MRSVRVRLTLPWICWAILIAFGVIVGIVQQSILLGWNAFTLAVTVVFFLVAAFNDSGN